MSNQTEINKAIVRRIYDDIWNQGRLDVADDIFPLPDVNVDELFTEIDDLQPRYGAAGVKRYIRTFLAAFPDLQHHVELMVAEDDWVVTRWTASGTHSGQWHDIVPTNKAVTFSGVTLARLSKGRIIEHGTLWDTLGLLEQLALVPMIRKADGTRL